MKVGIIGFGLIGASLADLISHTYPNIELNIYELNENHRSEMSKKDYNSKIVLDLKDLTRCKYIFICTPTASIPDIISQLIPLVSDECIIIDTGSVKQSTITPIEQKFSSFQNFVPGHPLGGGRETGPYTASKEILFKKPFILTPYQCTSVESVKSGNKFLCSLGLKTYITSAEKHDKFIALTSHLTHIISYMLVERFYELFDVKELSEEDISGSMHFIGNSFMGMSKFAASDSQMWSDIIKLNGKNINTESDKFIEKFQDFIKWSDSSNKNEIKEYLELVREKQNWLEDKKNECA